MEVLECFTLFIFKGFLDISYVYLAIILEIILAACIGAAVVLLVSILVFLYCCDRWKYVYYDVH